MKIDLKKYMNERDQLRAQKKDPGPLVTISRAYGCEANDITLRLLRRVNKRLSEKSVNAKPWGYINKEIIQDAAKALKLPVERVEQRVVQHHEHSGMMEQMLTSMGGAWSLTDKAIISKVNEIIQTYAHDGRVIIVGRGGAMLTRCIKKSVHVRIFAPTDWRVSFIANKYQLSQIEAEEKVRQHDLERRQWAEHLSGQVFDEHLFDLLLNRKTMNTDEMVDIIFNMMVKRELI
jgi:cytidylate kinase